MKFRKKPVVIEATQWFKNGDHPLDGDDKRMEGAVVRYFRHPDIKDDDRCQLCDRAMIDHGWIDTLESPDGFRVCPGDWIITGVHNEMYPIKPAIFADTYERAD